MEESRLWKKEPDDRGLEVVLLLVLVFLEKGMAAVGIGFEF